MNLRRKWQPVDARVFLLCGILARTLALAVLFYLGVLLHDSPIPHPPLFHAGLYTLPPLLTVAILSLSGLIGLLGLWYRRLSRHAAELATALEAVRAENAEQQQRLTVLVESEDRYHSMFDNAYDGMVCLSADGIILDLNYGQEVLSGWSREQLLGCHYGSFLTPASRAQVKERGQRFQAGEKISSIYEQEFLRPDGSSILVESRSRFIRNAQGKPIGVLVISRDITDRKRMEEKLRESEQRYRQIVDNANDLIVTFDTQGNFTSANSSHVPILGWTPEELIGKHYSTITTPASLVLNEARQQRFLTGDKPSLTYEIEVYHKDGHIVTLEGRTRLIRNANGEPTGIMGVYRDVTERKRMEEQLRESEERFRSLCAASPMGIFCNDAHGSCIYTNARWQADYGVTFEESLGDRWLQALHPDDRQRVLNDWYAQAESGKGYVGEYRVLKPDGEVRWVRVRTKSIENTAGQLIGHVGITEDVTERKHIEEQLRASEARFRTLCAASPIGIFIGNAEGACEYTNDRWQQIYGLSPEESLGTAWVDVTHPEDRQLALMRWREQTQRKEEYFQEFRLLTSQEEVRWVQVRAQPLAQGTEVTGYVGTVEDITEQKQAEGALLRSYVELERRVQERTCELAQAKESAELANRAKTQFLANMSHELRTPMHAIIGFAKFGLKKYQTLSPDEQADNLTEIHSSAENLLKLLNNLLDLSKLEAGQMRYELHLHSPEVLVHAVSKELQPLLEQKHLTLTIETTMPLPDMECDEGKIRQVLRNIIANAIKFTEPQRTITVSVEILTDGTQAAELIRELQLQSPPLVSSSGYICITIRDQGIGVPEGELESIFDKFVQSSKTRTGAGGTGLGLAICREIIQAHHGRIWAENNPTGGACISFLLPLHQPRPDALLRQAA